MPAEAPAVLRVLDVNGITITSFSTGRQYEGLEFIGNKRFLATYNAFSLAQVFLLRLGSSLVEVKTVKIQAGGFNEPTYQDVTYDGLQIYLLVEEPFTLNMEIWTLDWDGNIKRKVLINGTGYKSIHYIGDDRFLMTRESGGSTVPIVNKEGKTLFTIPFVPTNVESACMFGGHMGQNIGLDESDVSGKKNFYLLHIPSLSVTLEMIDFAGNRIKQVKGVVPGSPTNITTDGRVFYMSGA